MLGLPLFGCDKPKTEALSGMPDKQPELSALQALSSNPLLQNDERLRLLVKKPSAYSAFILGSFPAYSYDVHTLGAYLDAEVYNLAGEHWETNEAVFDFAVEYLKPTCIFFSVSPCDFLPDSTLKSAFATRNLATGGVFHGFEDVVRIGDAAEYENNYGSRFLPQAASEHADPPPDSADAVLALLEKMNRICSEKNIRLITVVSPVFSWQMTDQLRACCDVLDQNADKIGEYYNFSQNERCSDMRFFYNPNEFRTSFGNLILAEIFGDTTVGTQTVFSPTEVKLPILLYHHVTKEAGYGDSVISVSRLKEHLAALKNAGYTTISLAQAEDFVLHGTPLPEKPICITFDDGYQSNLTLALPLLREYQMKASVFYIGWAVGKDTYKDTGKPMLPHFDWEAAREIQRLGHIEFGSHTYDMHQSEVLEPPKTARIAAQPLENESQTAFVQALKQDCERFHADFEKAFGKPPRFFSYPHGRYSLLSEKILANEGYTVTLSTEYNGRNLLIPGLEQSLRLLYRLTVGEHLTGENLLCLIDAVYAAP